ncbi:hypothetical protein [Streptomyces sp. RerS4]|uniref:hypothetical protein n=1 Tax=Streptomyces sp. RerS4 TaxID=2942449 RepID=UPI00201BDDA5|nr:hypothetical protein [Streptomyces sp. RerS4]UQX04046.1 hypothetical protein M4D82_28715 [Streptomyces sp. RerS4]
MPPRLHRRTRRVLLVLAALCGVALSCEGCGTATDHDGAAARTRPATVEDIASAIGCTAQVSIDVDELRQGGCETADGAFRVTTFVAERALRVWLDETRAYGGTYLVGNRWVVTAPSPQALTPVRARLGGSVETTAPHGSAPDHTGH